MILDSLRHRLLAIAAFAVFAVMTLHIVIEVNGHLVAADIAARSSAEDIAAAAIPLLQGTLITGDLATAQETLDNIMGHGRFQHVRLLGTDGIAVIIEGRRKGIGENGTVPHWFAALIEKRFDVRRFPVAVGGVDYGVLEFAPNARLALTAMWTTFRSDSISGLLLIALQLLLLGVMLNRALGPLENLVDTAHRLGVGDLTSRMATEGSRELRATAQAFNLMADNLAEERQRLEDNVRRRTAELAESEQRFRVLFECAPEAIVVLDAKKGVFVDANEKALSLYRMSREDLMRTSPERLSPPHQPDGRASVESAFEKIRRVGAGEHLVFEWVHRDAAGRDIPCEISLARLPSEGRVLIRGSIVDITARKEAEARIAHLAHHDPMTGLLNRFSFEDHMHRALAIARRELRALAVLFIDLDNFKWINDNLGHAAGDQLLKEAARRLLTCVRESDIVSRQGGDEFVVVLTGADCAESAPHVGGKILAALGAPYLIHDTRAVSTPSIGIACYPRDGDDAETLLRKADAAMYRAKARGRNNIQIYADAEDAAASGSSSVNTAPPSA